VAASFEIRTKPDLVLDPVYKYEGRWSIPRAGCACDLDFDLCRGEKGRRRCGMCRFGKRSPAAPAAKGKEEEGLSLAAGASVLVHARSRIYEVGPISNFVFASAPTEDICGDN
jgi:hypothetical protein